VTQTATQRDSGSTAPAPLLALIDSGQLDWDNPRHREAYLRAWVKGGLPARKAEGPAGDR
jgi:hypothetical protein